jgi:hypothetical protein
MFTAQYSVHPRNVAWELGIKFEVTYQSHRDYRSAAGDVCWHRGEEIAKAHGFQFYRITDIGLVSQPSDR